MKVDQISISEPKTVQKEGKNKGKNYWQIGVKIGDTWHNGFTMFEDQIARAREWKPGDNVPIELYQEEYNGAMQNKFKFLSPLQSKVNELENRIIAIEGVLKGKSTTLDMEKELERVAEQETTQSNSDLPF